MRFPNNGDQAVKRISQIFSKLAQHQCIYLSISSCEFTLKNLLFPVIWSGQLLGTPAAQAQPGVAAPASSPTVAAHKPSCQTLQSRRSVRPPHRLRPASATIRDPRPAARHPPWSCPLQRGGCDAMGGGCGGCAALAAWLASGVGTPRGFVQGVLPGPGLLIRTSAGNGRERRDRAKFAVGRLAYHVWNGSREGEEGTGRRKSNGSGSSRLEAR